MGSTAGVREREEGRRVKIALVRPFPPKRYADGWEDGEEAWVEKM